MKKKSKARARTFTIAEVYGKLIKKGDSLRKNIEAGRTEYQKELDDNEAQINRLAEFQQANNGNNGGQQQPQGMQPQHQMPDGSMMPGEQHGGQQGMPMARNGGHLNMYNNGGYDPYNGYGNKDFSRMSRFSPDGQVMLENENDIGKDNTQMYRGFASRFPENGDWNQVNLDEGGTPNELYGVPTVKRNDGNVLKQVEVDGGISGAFTPTMRGTSLFPTKDYSNPGQVTHQPRPISLESANLAQLNDTGSPMLSNQREAPMTPMTLRGTPQFKIPAPEIGTIAPKEIETSQNSFGNGNKFDMGKAASIATVAAPIITGLMKKPEDSGYKNGMPGNNGYTKKNQYQLNNRPYKQGGSIPMYDNGGYNEIPADDNEEDREKQIVDEEIANSNQSKKIDDYNKQVANKGFWSTPGHTYNADSGSWGMPGIATDNPFKEDDGIYTSPYQRKDDYLSNAVQLMPSAYTMSLGLKNPDKFPDIKNPYKGEILNSIKPNYESYNPQLAELRRQQEATNEAIPGMSGGSPQQALRAVIASADIYGDKMAQNIAATNARNNQIKTEAGLRKAQAMQQFYTQEAGEKGQKRQFDLASAAKQEDLVRQGYEGYKDFAQREDIDKNTADMNLQQMEILKKNYPRVYKEIMSSQFSA